MSFQTAAAVALGEVSKAASSVTNQVQTNTKAAQCLLSQSQTGKNPASKINPPTKNNPAKYEEDDEAIVRGSAMWLAKVMNRAKASIEDVHKYTSKKVGESNVDGDFNSNTAPGFSDRLAKIFKDISRIATAVTANKDQGHTVQKNAEILVNVSKVTHNQAGSAIYNEAPILINAARILVTRGVLQITEVADRMTKADTDQYRVNHQVISANRISRLITGSDTTAVDGDYKVIQKNSAKDIVFQAGRDFIAKTLNGAIKLLSKTLVTIEAQQGIDIAAGGAMTLSSAASVTMKGSAIDITAAGIINLGGGSPGSTPSVPSADSIEPQNLTAIPKITAEATDKKPGMLFETRPGLNPPGAVLPRVNKNDEPNR